MSRLDLLDGLYGIESCEFERACSAWRNPRLVAGVEWKLHIIGRTLMTLFNSNEFFIIAVNSHVADNNLA